MGLLSPCVPKWTAFCRNFTANKSNTVMFRLDNILEKWAEIYRPLQHDPAAKAKHKTFFRIGMIDGQSYFVRNYNTQPSPCMAYATHVDADMERNQKSISYRHVIYFLVKQQNAAGKTDVTDELAAADARYDTDEMVQDLLAFLSQMQTAAGNSQNELKIGQHTFAITKDERQGWRGLQIDGAHWGTLPTHFHGWQICGLTIEPLQPRLLRVAPTHYRD